MINNMQKKYSGLFELIWIIEAEWRIYTSVNYATIGLDNGLSPVWRQTIIKPMLDYCQLGRWEQNSVIFFYQYTQLFICKNASDISSAKWRPFLLGSGVNESIALDYPKHSIRTFTDAWYWRSVF